MKKFLNVLLSVSVLMMCLSGLSLVAFAESVAIGDVTIEQDADGYYIIDSAAKFEAVFSKTNTKKTDLLTGENKFKQTQPFTLSNTYFPVDVNFTGTYDGNGCTITLPSDLSIGANNFGLFKNLAGATIKNLTIDGTITAAKGWVGIFAGNVTAKTTNYITNCTNSVDISSTQSYIAGFITSNKGTVHYTNCTNNGNIKGKDYVSGFDYGGYNATVTFTNCINKGNIEGTSAYVAGFASRTDKSTFKNCTNEGAITGTDYVGGFMGGSNGKFTDCVNKGKVTATLKPTSTTSGGCAGGFIGGIVGGSSGTTFTTCANTGDLTSYGEAGGFIGTVTVTETININKCYNEGNVNAWFDRGGFIGAGYCNSKTINVNITDCYNAGYIQGSNEIKGSLIGSLDTADISSTTYTIDNSYDILNPSIDVVYKKLNTSTSITCTDTYILNASPLLTDTYGKSATAEMLTTEVPEAFTESVWAVKEETGYPYIQLVDNLYTPGNDVTVQPVKGTYVFTGTTTENLSDVEGIEDVTTPYAIVAAKFAYNNTAVLESIQYGVLISEVELITVGEDGKTIDNFKYDNENVQIAYGNKNVGGRYGILIYGTNLQAEKTYYVRPFVTNGTKYWYGDADSFALSD